ncbi:MAG: hypothetical protein NTX49_07055 [Chlamydiae bacterium]|nr:hypothetical protein [Chlamydiota bacterium]
MCFSAPVSFTASVILGAVGIALLARVRELRLVPLALIPLFFALQQAAEGFVWLSVPEVSTSKNIYLFFAYVFWPIWIPFSLYFAEKSPVRKQLLALCLGMGLVLGSALMLGISQVVAIEHNHTIHYQMNDTYDAYDMVSLVFFTLAGLLPFFISSLTKMWGVGLLITLAGIATFTLDRFCFFSLWCFWAAIFSVSLFFVLPQKKVVAGK